MNRVFVLSCDRKPLMPCHPARARQLLRGGWAAVFRRKPFTIILNYKIDKPKVQKTRIKIDPGSKQTGISIVTKGKRGWKVTWAGVLEHRGNAVKKLLEKRRNVRRSRRSRKTRYRKPRFLNRVRPKGWLPPSLQSRVDNILTWINRLCRFCHVTAISVEHVKFDTHKLKNPEIKGVEYQWGTLFGYEVKEYLLEKWGHKCAYCGKKNVPLEVEHIIPKSRGGSNLVTNLTLACRKCNMKKGNKTAAEFGYPQLEKKARQSFRDAAAVNSTRIALVKRLRMLSRELNLAPLVRCTGARTKYNRIKQGYPKEHWVDAACACKSGSLEKCRCVVYHRTPGE